LVPNLENVGFFYGNLKYVELLY